MGSNKSVSWLLRLLVLVLVLTHCNHQPAWAADIASTVPLTLSTSTVEPVSPVVVPPALSLPKPVTGPAPAQFGGRDLYSRACELLRDKDLSLKDKAARDKWYSQWSTKHTTDHVLDTENGTDQAIGELVASVGERFTYYKDREATKHMLEEQAGEFAGIGAMVKQKGLEELIKSVPQDPTEDEVDKAFRISSTHPLEVQSTIEGSPAQKAGLQESDIITKVDNQSTNGMSLKEVISKIRGKPGTPVVLTIQRAVKGATTTISITITRALVVMKSVAYKELNDGIAYIKLTDFMSNEAEHELSVAITQASTRSALILDLRDNVGGRLNCAITLCQYLLNEGTILVSQERQDDTIQETHYFLLPRVMLVEDQEVGKLRPDQADFQNRARTLLPESTPLVVLINDNSASASEIVCGALKQNHRATIVGKRTFGKGVGQIVFPLSTSLFSPPERFIAITTFEFLPGGKSMDWMGVSPDIEVPSGNGKEDVQLAWAVNTAQKLILESQLCQSKDNAIKNERQNKYKKAVESRAAKKGQPKVPSQPQPSPSTKPHRDPNSKQ